MGSGHSAAMSALSVDGETSRNSGDDSSHFLLPGDIIVTEAPATLSAVVGSCVALCLLDVHKKIGGMNHYLLPDGPIDAANRLRYANNANAALLERVIRAGANIAYVVAMVCGGSSVHAATGGEQDSLGHRNVCAALDFLRSTGIPLEARLTGGAQARRITFDLQTGKIVPELL